jgi:PEP-CTERM motif
MNTHRTWQYGLLVLALLLSSPASQAVSVFPNVDHFSVTLERRDVNDPDSEILGSGSFRLDLGVVNSAFTQYQADVDFCRIHGSDPEHSDFCDMLPFTLVVEAPVLFGVFEMFGHTFTTEDFQWLYFWDPFTEEQLSLEVAFGSARWCDGGLCSQPRDPFLVATTGLVLGYLVNGFRPLGNPTCDNDNHTCEGLQFGPAPALPEPGSLGLLSLGLAAFGFARRRPLV